MIGALQRSAAEAAEAYASEDRLSVFPANGKRPLTPHGFLDASMDIEQVRGWWRRWPNANVALPTGKGSGLVVVDVDPRHGGRDSLDRLEPLPATFTVSTGGGGRHAYFVYPRGGLRNNAGTLGPGIDIRGDGGYVIVPPSVTEARYAVAKELPVAELPGWVVEMCATSARGARGGSGDRKPVAVEGPPIVSGQRNDVLFRIACSLRGRGYERASILASLEGVNLKRCRPPLGRHPDDGVDELARIADSACRYALGNGPRVATLEVQVALDAIEAGIGARRWPGVGGQSQWKILVALAKHARRYGEMIPGGIRVSISHRQLAELAAMTRKTAGEHLQRMREARLLNFDNEGRRLDEAGAVVLLEEPLARPSDSSVPHLHQSSIPSCSPGEDGVALSQLPGLRASVAGLRRLSPGAGRAFEALLRLGGEASKRELAEALRQRTSNLTRKHGALARLVDAGMVERDGDAVRVLATWPEALDAARQAGAEDQAADAQRALHHRDRAIFAYKQDPNELGAKRLDRAAEEYETARAAYKDARDVEGSGSRDEGAITKKEAG